MPIFEHNGKYGLFIHIPKTGGKSIIEYLKDGGCRVSFTDDASAALGLAGLRRPEWDATWQVSSELLQERDMSRAFYWTSHEAEQVCGGPVYRSRYTSFSGGSWRLPVTPQHVQRDILESSFKLDKISWIFTMVRDPIGRCVSQYGPPNMKEGFDSWIKAARERWKINPYYADNHFRPQADFILPKCKVFTYPHYDELINYLEVEVGLPKSEFKKIGASLGPIPTISHKSKRLIKEWYHNDYEFLKKTFYRKILHLS
tara:strand:+ start:1264 stop:2034 length:771 start_codon:yes stop_codon:yes gene_type:complete